MILLFLDGVGLGDPDPAINPFSAVKLPTLTRLVGAPPDRHAPPRTAPDLVFRPVDATLGHEGLPQSATGQATILTGLNGAAIMNGHYGPWPGPTLVRTLSRGTLFHDAATAGGAALANVYPPRYFATEGRRRFRPNAPVVAAQAAGVRLRGLDDYRDGWAVAPDLVGDGLARLSESVAFGLEPAGLAGTAAALTRLSAENAFTFVDVWLTDGFGHRRDMEGASRFLEHLDAFLSLLVDEPAGAVNAGATVVITSDHGNLEDMSVKGHTRNPVPLLVLGRGADRFADATSLLDVAPAVRRVLH